MSALQELQNYTFVSKYARWLPDKKRRETWKEAVDRVRNMMLEKYHDKGIDDDINWAYDMMLKKKILGSQRAMQFGGKPIFDHNCRIYNCSFSVCDRLRFFQECFYTMLCGSGVGYSVQLHDINKLPKLQGTVQEHVNKPIKKYVISDTIEGWSDSIGVLLSTYFNDPIFLEFKNYRVQFDFSKIRPKGSYLSSSSGKAPGPEPLKNALKKIDSLLFQCIQNNLVRIKPIYAHDIIMHIADATLSGGIRRSSCICLFSYTDNDMMDAKTDNWLQENPQRARANNSVVLKRNETTYEQFKEIMIRCKLNGEPGFFFTDDKNGIGTNPCSEIGLFSYNQQGKSGFQFCNLSEINCSTIKDEEDFYNRCKAASIIGTLQSAFTNFPYLGKITEDIVRQEALLGVSLTGMMQKPNIVFGTKVQKKGAKIVKETNKKFAKIIGINQAARTCCVKPSGTASLVLNSTAGIHPAHSKRYIRNVQANRMESPYQLLKSTNQKACQKSVWSANNTDDIVSFPVEVPDGSKTKNQVSALDMLNYIKLTYENWVVEGKNKDLCVHPDLNHSVSNTVVVKENEWDEAIDFLYKNRKYFCSVSFLPFSGDKDYPQAPFTTVYTSHELVAMYGDAAIWCSGLIERALQLFEGDLWKACNFILDENYSDSIQNNGLAKPKQIGNILITKANRIEFVDRCHRFADKYMEGNYKRLCYCLKDVYLWKDYCDLQREFKPVDYTQLIEETDETTPEAELACLGGACLI